MSEDTKARLYTIMGVVIAVTILVVLVAYLVAWHDAPNLIRLFGFNV